MNIRFMILFILMILLAACGGQATSTASSEQPAAEAPAATEPTATSEPESTAAEVEPTATPAAEVVEAGANAFPVSIEHKYGSTEITKQPERIVTVGLTEQDALLALGIVPVGTTEWFGEYPGAIWPWAQEALGDAPIPELVGDAAAINFEKLSALKPDLILALYAGLTQEQYDILAQIAPTVAQPAAYVDYGIPWQELTRTVGLTVGQAEQADQLVKEVEARFEQALAEHPEFDGASSIVATPYEGIWVYAGEDVRGRFLNALGFKLPEGLTEITGDEFGGNLSFERADLLDVDVIIWLDADEAQGPLGGPVYQNLAVHTEGREVHLDSYDDPLGGATSFVSVLSLPFLLDGLVPQLAAALDKLPDSEAQAEAPADDTPNADTTSAGSRTVTHDLGVAEVPADPQRIVAINSAAIELLATLDIKPVGIAPWIGAGNPAQVPAHISEAMDLTGVEFVGDANQPNLEAIAAVEPDLILMSGGGYYQELYDQVSQIAPTVAYAAWPEDSPRSYWKEYFINTATAMGKEEQAQAVIDAWQARIAEFKAAASVDEKHVSVTRLMPDSIMAYQKGSYSGTVLEDAGVKQIEAQEVVNFAETISMEQLPKLDGDILLLIQSDPQAAIYNQLLTSPLWQQLEAVQADQVYLVNTDIWIGGDGYISANLILDDLERLFLEDGAGLTKAE